jgi:23S rRNA-/tRNA-specific pseudouridylate synthase
MVVAGFPECARVFRSPGDGGLLQRLDRETSGLVLVARRQEVLALLADRQEGGGIEKRYLALVPRGADALPAVIRAPLGSAGPRGARVVSRENGRPARTELVSVRVWGEWQLVQATILKGRRHQIRAHLAGAGFPIAGDAIYGKKDTLAGLDRLFLHASGLRLAHPVSGRQLDLTAPLPDSLAEIIGSD